MQNLLAQANVETENLKLESDMDHLQSTMQNLRNNWKLLGGKLLGFRREIATVQGQEFVSTAKKQEE